jgi:hypothetical protein
MTNVLSIRRALLSVVAFSALLLACATPARADWNLIINDTFESGGVPDHWHLYDGPYGSGPHNCASPEHASVSDGVLHMRMSYEPGGTCGPGWYTAGMMIDKSLGAVNQRIDVRWRVVSDGVRSHRNIPMRWPESGSWPSAGEEDFCEGSELSGCSTFLHYGATAPGSQVVRDIDADLTRWHTMSFMRYGTTVKAWLDTNVGGPVYTYRGTLDTLPQTFKRTVLQQECRSIGCPSDQTGSEDIQIDWIHIYEAV